MAVLISGNAGADRVFLTAALQDQKRAIVVGHPTSGSTYVRSLFSLPNQDRIRIAVALLQRGNGTTLLETGQSTPLDKTFQVRPRRRNYSRVKAPVIIPNHRVRTPPIPGTRQADPILKKAVEVLSKNDVRSNLERESERES